MKILRFLLLPVFVFALISGVAFAGQASGLPHSCVQSLTEHHDKNTDHSSHNEHKNHRTSDYDSHQCCSFAALPTPDLTFVSGYKTHESQTAIDFVRRHMVWAPFHPPRHVLA